MEKKKKRLIERDLEYSNVEITEHHWNEAGDIARFPDEAIIRLINHIMTVMLKEKGEASVVGLQKGVARFLYPDPKMLSWGEKRLKRKPELTPSELAYQYAKEALDNIRMGPSLIRDMQKLKARVQLRDKRKQWRKMSGRKVHKRMEGPKPRIPGNAAYFEKVIASRLVGKTGEDVGSADADTKY